MAESKTTIFASDILFFSNELRRTVVEGVYFISVTDIADTISRSITLGYTSNETLEAIHATDR